MIVYFADRYMNILGQASTKLPHGLTITEDLKTDDVETGVSSFECVIPYDDSTRTELERCCKVGNYILRSHENETEFYTIIESEKDTSKQEVEVYAEDAGLDLLNEVVGTFEADKAYDLAYYVNKYIADSGFVIGINEAKGLTRKLAWEGEATVTERIASIATQFGGFEVSYSFEIKGLAITKMCVNIFKKRGKDLGVEIRLNNQVNKIITTESIYNVATALQCEGGTPEEEETPITLQGYKYDDGDFYVSGNRLCSREALKTWNRFKGKDGHIVRQYSYDTTSQATLCAHAITELKKLREVEVNYEVEIAALPDNAQVGDRVNVIDDKGELYLSTRLLQLKTSVCDQTHKAVLGEYLIKGDGISAKVERLAAEFAAQTVSVKRAQAIAGNAVTIANNAKTQAETALNEANAVTGIANAAKTQAEAAEQSASNAQAEAQAAQAAVDKVEEGISSIETTVQNAKDAAENAEAAAETATQKAEEAKTAAENAQNDVAEATNKAEAANTAATNAINKANEAKSTAEIAKGNALSAINTANAAKLDAEQAEKDIETFSEKLETVKTTMSAEYARKTDLTEAQAELQTQVSQNAARIESSAHKLVVIDETTNDARDKAESAQEQADLAQEQADEALAYANSAQEEANNARIAANNAQAEADTARIAAETARQVADEAEADLKAAKVDLATVQARVDATEEEIAAAQQAVDTAQAAAIVAIADAESAQATAEAAQEAANNAVRNAEKAQAQADFAAEQADISQQVADEAKGNADRAKQTAGDAISAAEQAQETANTARETANSAQEQANNARQTADNAAKTAYDAKTAMDNAETALTKAQARLEELQGAAETTAEELAEAEAAVETAQTAVNDAATAYNTAQAAADEAAELAAQAQTDADTAKKAADEAQAVAFDAQALADIAKGLAAALYKRTVEADTKIAQNADAISLRATKRELIENANSLEQSFSSALNVLAEKISFDFEATNKSVTFVDGELNTLLETLTKHFDFSATGLNIKTNEGAMNLTLDNDLIIFKKNGQTFGWWDGVNFHTGNIVVEVNERAQFGNFAFVPRSDGSLMFLKVGG